VLGPDHPDTLASRSRLASAYEQAGRRGRADQPGTPPVTHRSVTELETDTRKWINEWNKHPKPFVWTKSADDILETVAEYCQRIIDSGH
jgi:hypothetical protein